MFDLPTGTVTFLLTDVEGSTALWEAAPEAMRAAFARHDALFEQAVAERRGVHIRPRSSLDRADGASVPIRLAALTNVSAIRRGAGQSRIELDCMGSTIAASVNGTQVAAVRDTMYSASWMWIGGNVDTETVIFGHALFDNLAVRG